MFKTVGIVGVGLIGGSLSLSIKKKNLADRVLGFDISSENIDKALNMGLIDEACNLDCISKAELVLVATPVSSIADYVIEVCRRSEALILDVGSVKKPIVDKVIEACGRSINYIPMHPIAGTENFGPEAAFEGLFEGAFCIITPFEGLKESLIEIASGFLTSLGMVVKIMEPALHDEVFGYVSHLPHVIAYALVNLIFEKPREFRFIGGGFRDYTRVAASSEFMWTDIFLMNKENVVRAIEEYIDELAFIKELIEKDDRARLVEYLKMARVFKRELDG